MPPPPSWLSPKRLLAAKLARAAAAALLASTYLLPCQVVVDDVDDDSDIETSVTAAAAADTKIVLRNVRLVPKVVTSTAVGSSCCELAGTIEELTFTWKWGGSSGGSCSSWLGEKGGDAITALPFISEPVLSVRGVHLQLTVSSSSSSSSKSEPCCSKFDKAEESSTSSAGTFMFGSVVDRCVQQLLDHLTVLVTDVRVAFILKNDDDDDERAAAFVAAPTAQLVLEAAHVRLDSRAPLIARECLPTCQSRQRRDGDNNSSAAWKNGGSALLLFLLLERRVSVESMRVFFLQKQQQNDAEVVGEVPLLRSLSYAARFHDTNCNRDTTGGSVEVTGETSLLCNHNDPPVVELHVGTEQLALLTPILKRLLHRLALDSADATAADDQAVVQQPPAFDDSTSHSSNIRFVLPLPSVVVVLSDESKIGILSKSTLLRYHTDGSVLQWTGGGGGIHVNGKPAMQLEKNAVWCLDFVRSNFTITNNNDDADADCFVDGLGELPNADDNDDNDRSQQTALVEMNCDEEDLKRLVVDLTALKWFIRNTMEIAGAFNRDGENSSSSSVPVIGSEQAWSVSVRGLIALQVSGVQGELIKATIKNIAFRRSSAVVAAANDGGLWLTLFSDFSTDGASFGPTSFGDATIRIPGGVYLTATDESGEFCVREPISCHFQSASVAEAIRQFMLRLISIELSSPPVLQISTAEAECPVSLQIPQLLISVAEPRAIEVKVESVRCSMRDKTITCDSVCWEEVNGGNSGLMNGLCFGQHVALRADCIESLRIAGVSSLVPRQVRGAKIRLDEDRLDIHCPSVNAALDEVGHCISASSDSVATSPASIFSGTAVALPFAIYLHVNEIFLYDSKERSTAVRIFPVEMVIASYANNCTVENCDTVIVRIESSKNEWMQATLTGFSFNLDHGCFTPKTAILTGLHVGPCSYGELRLAIPSIRMESEGLFFGGFIVATVESADVAVRTQKIFEQALAVTMKSAPLSESHALPLNMPYIEMNLIDMKLQAVASDIVFRDWSKIQCGHLKLSDGMGSTISASRVDSNYADSSLRMTAVLDVMYIPGVCYLAEPVNDILIFYNFDSGLHVNVPVASVFLLEGETNGRDSGGSLVLPCRIQLKLGALTLANARRDSFLTRARGVEVDLQPATGLRIGLKADLVEHKMIRLFCTRASGVIGDFITKTILDFQFQPEFVTVAAELSSVEWSKLFDKKEADGVTDMWQLPYGRLGSFTAKLSFDGKMVSTESALRIPAFEGGSNTTSADIVEHLASVGLRELPSLYNNARVLGESATDLTVKAAGRMAGSTVSYSALLSISALVVADSVKGVLVLGREARGASVEDKHQLSDVVLGIYRAMQTAALRGGRLRRGDVAIYRYRFGDLSTGVSDALGRYISDNKSRFGAAGGSVLGMAVGGMIYGFVGVMVGNYLGGKVGAKALGSEKSNLRLITGVESLVPLQPSFEECDGDWVLLDLASSDSQTYIDCVGLHRGWPVAELSTDTQACPTMTNYRGFHAAGSIRSWIWLRRS